MNVTIVESTSLATVAYDDARKLLQLEFCVASSQSHLLVGRLIDVSRNTVHLRTFWWYSVLGAKASPRGHLMNVTIVESTSLATVAYDDARKFLLLEFCSRAIYQYFGVPAA